MINEKKFTKIFPNISSWIEEHGWIEIGSDENSKSLVRALDEGGLVWESSDQQRTIDEALQALDNSLAEYIEKNE